MTRTMPSTARTSRSAWGTRSRSLDDASTATDHHGVAAVRLPSIAATPRAALKTVATCPTKLSAQTHPRCDDTCVCIDYGSCQLKRQVPKHLLEKRHSTGEITSRTTTAHRQQMVSERLHRPQTARQRVTLQRSDVMLQRSDVTLQRSDVMACDAESPSEVEECDVIDDESIEKCRRWLQTLPGKFSGLCRVLSVPDSSPGYDDVTFTTYV